MQTKLILAICALFISQFAFAETCPTVNDIKNHALKGWKAYDSDDGSALSAQREAEFIKYADQFALAEWSTDEHQKGTIHCYYRDKNGSDLEAYFAKGNLALSDNKQYWYQVSGFMQCAAGMDQCAFKNNPPQEHRLANN